MRFSISIIATRKPLSRGIGAGSLAPGWFSIPYRCVPNKKDRRFSTGRWFKLTSKDGSIYRVLRFSSTSFDEESQECDLVLDYDGWLKLCGYAEKIPERIETLLIRQCHLWERVFCVIGHPDPAYQLSGWLGIISVILGLLGVALAIK